MKRAADRSAEGFSLLEMAISLTVIAMIIAALTVTQQIKTRLLLNQVVDDRGALETAVSTFEQRYSGLPGDFWNAKSVFGNDKTENGDGDSILETEVGDGVNETLRFWQHLQLESLIQGSYDGVTDGPGGRMQAPVNKGYYAAGNEDLWGEGTHVLYILAEKPGGQGLFSAREAADYDSKYDDHSALTGSIRTRESEGASGGACLTTGGEYNVSNKEEGVCRVYFRR